MKSYLPLLLLTFVALASVSVSAEVSSISASPELKGKKWSHAIWFSPEQKVKGTNLTAKGMGAGLAYSDETTNTTHYKLFFALPDDEKIKDIGLWSQSDMSNASIGASYNQSNFIDANKLNCSNIKKFQSYNLINCEGSIKIDENMDKLIKQQQPLMKSLNESAASASNQTAEQEGYQYQDLTLLAHTDSLDKSFIGKVYAFNNSRYENYFALLELGAVSNASSIRTRKRHQNVTAPSEGLPLKKFEDQGIFLVRLNKMNSSWDALGLFSLATADSVDIYGSQNASSNASSGSVSRRLDVSNAIRGAQKPPTEITEATRGAQKTPSSKVSEQDVFAGEVEDVDASNWFVAPFTFKVAGRKIVKDSPQFKLLSSGGAVVEVSDDIKILKGKLVRLSQ